MQNGERQFGLRIGDDGTLDLTCYRTSYTQYFPQNQRLSPTRPWEEEPPDEPTE